MLFSVNACKDNGNSATNPSDEAQNPPVDEEVVLRPLARMILAPPFRVKESFVTVPRILRRKMRIMTCINDLPPRYQRTSKTQYNETSCANNKKRFSRDCNS